MEEKLFEMMEKMNNLFDNIEVGMRQGFESISKRLDGMENKLEDRFDAMLEFVKKDNEDLSEIKGTLDEIKKLLDGKNIIMPESEYILFVKKD